LQPVRYRFREAVSRWFEQPAARLLSRLGFTPTRATLAGLAVSGAAAYFAATGWFWMAGLLNAGGSLFDLLDGAIARSKGQVSKRGALLDSSADRVAEAGVLTGLAWHYSDALTFDVSGELSYNRTAILLAFLALTGSMMVSYVRARAEGLGYKGTSGFLTRPERVVIMTVCLLIGRPIPALWILAVGTPLSALHRFWAEWRAAGRAP
jgi:CDP-diacylglycerol--glycerol-3-phosphate 3-phosphatidyltransferase